MATVRDIAKSAGVSVATVSRVLNNHPKVSDEARDRVLSAANQARYVSTVGRRSTTNIAFVYTGESSLGSPFDAALMRGMAMGMEEFGFDLMVLDARRARLSHETYSQMFMRKGIRGAVLRTTAQATEVCQAVAAEGFPSVTVGYRIDDPSVSYLYSDSREASREAVEHLLGLGHKRIAICLNVVDDTDHLDRLAGYESAMTAAGLDVDSKLIIRAPARRDGGEQLIRRLAAMSPQPTAVFITDPDTAVGALSEARKTAVRVPEDLSIVGFDDAEMRYTVYPELTAVCQDAVALGREAFSVLNEMLARRPISRLSSRENPNPPAYHAAVIQRSLHSWLEVHDSAGPPVS